MCSRNNDESGSTSLMEARPKQLWTEFCQKCSTKKPVIQILQIKHAYCRTCFVAHVIHKFRSTLGKSKIMKPSDVVLTALSGSIKSHVLLHMLHGGLSEKSHKRFLFKARVLYIDEGAVLGLSLSERLLNLKLMSELVEPYKFQSYFTTLSSVFDTEGPRCFALNEQSTLHISDHCEKELLNMFDNVQSLTAKEDLLKVLRRQLLLLASQELMCNRLFTAQSSTDLAIQILTDVSLGRGSEMHNDVSFCDGRDEAVKILRPLLELSSKEIAFYSVYNKLESVFIPSLCTKAAPDRSIHNMSKQFVMELMENFPSTVSTVFRTGEKLGSGGSSNTLEENCNLCLICKGQLNVKATTCSSVQATEFSRLISSLGPRGFDNESLKSRPLEKCQNPVYEQACTPHNSKPDEACPLSTNNLQPFTLSEMEQLCCYGCRLILHDMNTPLNLPSSMLQNIKKMKDFKQMEDSIKDFLV